MVCPIKNITFLFTRDLVGFLECLASASNKTV